MSFIFSLKLAAKENCIFCHTWLGMLDPGNGTDRSSRIVGKKPLFYAA
jgi:hypothetical protein